MNRWVGEWVNGCLVDGWVGRWVDIWMDGGMEGQMGGRWSEEWMERQRYGFVDGQVKSEQIMSVQMERAEGIGGLMNGSVNGWCMIDR